MGNSNRFSTTVTHTPQPAHPFSLQGFTSLWGGGGGSFICEDFRQPPNHRLKASALLENGRTYAMIFTLDSVNFHQKVPNEKVRLSNGRLKEIND